MRKNKERIDLLPQAEIDDLYEKPIEKMWSKIKEILKRKKPRTKADFHDAILSAIESMNDNDFEEWYDVCGYALAA